MDEPKNFAFQSIAAAYALNWVPHGYYFARMMVASKGQATNVTPRTNLDTLKSRLPAETWKALACARGAHLNTLEGFPLFAACMIAGNVARVPPNELNNLAAQYLGVRVMYNVLYMTIRGEAASYLRSGVYVWSVAIPIFGLVRAAEAFNKLDS